MGVPLLPRLKAGAAIVDSSGNASQALGLLWNQLCVAIESALNAQEAQLVSLQTTLAQVQAALQAANAAIAIADAGGSPTAVSGSTSTGTAGVSPAPAWSPGPLVNLAGVAAGNLTVSLSFASNQSSGSPVSDSGHYRIQEIIAGVETTVFTGNLAIYTTLGPSGMGYVILTADLSTSSWSALNLARASTGAVGYRLDFQTDTITYNLSSAYLFARRA